MVEHDLAKVGVAGSSPVSRSILLLLAALLLAAPAAAQSLALAPGDPVPRVDGGTLENEPFVADWSGAKVTVLHFWGLDCEPCRPEIEALGALWREKRRRGLGVLGVVVDSRSREQVAARLEEVRAGYPVIFPSELTRRAWSSVTLLPSTFLVGPNGKVLRRYVGSDPETLAGMRADVLALLSGEPMPVQVVPGPDSGGGAKP